MPSILELKDRYIETFQDLLNFPVMNLESADLSNKIVYSLGATETSKMFRQSDLKALSDDLGETLDENGQKKYDQITKSFVDLLDEIKKRHDDGEPLRRWLPSFFSGAYLTFFLALLSSIDMITLGHGLKGLRDKLAESELKTSNLTEFLDPFNRGRIGIRLLIGQHVSLVKGAPEGHIGLVAPKCNISHVMKSASDAARSVKAILFLSWRPLNSELFFFFLPRFTCLQHYPWALPPNISFDVDPKLTFPYFPSVLYYITFEILKNSLRATVEFHERSKVIPGI